MRVLTSFLFLLLAFSILAQDDYYYPPLIGEEWQTVTPTELGWCEEQVPPLIDFVEETNGKAFIVLHKGNIVMEEYFGTFTQDSAWYWASAAKSLVAFLTGIAQEEGLLNIDDPTSDYLGEGWTNMTAEQEAAISIRHQISMSTGIDFDLEDLDCLEPECFNYLHPPGAHWFYHNGPYRLVQDVLSAATGQQMTSLTYTRLGATTGMTGVWNDYLFFSKPRSMARFGLLNLSRGKWSGTTILEDEMYFSDMLSSSQSSNPSYGYLWWLNGKDSHKLPVLDLSFSGQLVESAPADMYAALGKNDQKIYVVPSLDLVVVRVGNAADDPALALTGFDTDLWTLMMNVICSETAISQSSVNEAVELVPSLVTDYFSIETELEYTEIRVYDSQGTLVQVYPAASRYSVLDLTEGLYFAAVFNENQRIGKRKFLCRR